MEAGIEIDSLSIAFIKRQPEKMKKRNKKETTGETEIRKPEKWKIRGNEKRKIKMNWNRRKRNHVQKKEKKTESNEQIIKVLEKMEKKI